MNPVDAALAKKKKVTLSADTAECKYCGKVYHTGKKLTDHINQQHSGEQTIFACPFCTQPFNQYSEYLQHLGEHKNRVIRCRLCNKEFKTITRLRVHTKTHVNQCPFCSENILTPQALQVHVMENHETDLGAVERQCSLCEFTKNTCTHLSEKINKCAIFTAGKSRTRSTASLGQSPCSDQPIQNKKQSTGFLNTSLCGLSFTNRLNFAGLEHLLPV